MDTLIFLVLLFFIFYFVLLRPQQQRAKAHQRLLATLQKGSRVVTGGGIIGTVQKMEADGVAVVEIAQGIKVRVASGTIAEVLPEGKPATGTANDN
ncbi:MAG: preprotein translocase subunit YajC [Alphaproteobacteria bacterium]|nr:preprotein translocase subunit YajC [Alphaproteobacteria bacterium]